MEQRIPAGPHRRRCQAQSPYAICEVLPCRFTAEESDTILVQDSFMLIPAASHSGVSSVLTALPISGLKRRGRSAALCALWMSPRDGCLGETAPFRPPALTVICLEQREREIDKTAAVQSEAQARAGRLAHG